MNITNQILKGRVYTIKRDELTWIKKKYGLYYYTRFNDILNEQQRNMFNQVISFMSFKLHEENGRGELLHSQTSMLLKVVLTVIC